MGGELKARRNQGADRRRRGCGFGFTTVAAALSSHRRRKRKPGHLLAVRTKLPDRLAMSRRGARGTAPMPSGRPRARHLCLGFPTRTGDAPTQRRFAWVRGADAAPGFPALRRAQEAGAAVSNIPLPQRARGAPASPSTAASAPAEPPLRGEPVTRTPASAAAACTLPRLHHRSPGEAGGHRALCGDRLSRTQAVPYSGEHGSMGSPARPHLIPATASGKARQTATHTHCLPLSPACTVSERSCPGVAVLGNSFSFLALRFNPPELAASSSARSSPRFKGRLKPPLPPLLPPPAPLLAPAPPWC